jgi:transcriptional regulator with XRE-family HTH domain
MLSSLIQRGVGYPLNFAIIHYQPYGICVQPFGCHSFSGVFQTTPMSKPLSEKAAFAERLKLALTRSRTKIDTATELALQFNLRHRNDPITQQAAQKWLSGSACPTSDKIETLAEWLTVSAHWLRFGSPNEANSKRSTNKRQIKSPSNTSTLSNDENRLIERFRQLTPHQQNLIAEIVTQLALEKEIWPEQTGSQPG